MGVPLRNPEAERQLLMSLLVAPRRVVDVGHLVEEDFGESGFRVIWRAMVELAGRDFDASTLRAHMQAAGVLTGAISSRLDDLEASCLTAANLELHASTVAEHGVRRRLAVAAEEIAKLASERSDDVKQLVDRAERALFGVDSAAADGASIPSSEAVGLALKHLQLVRDSGDLSGVTTGLPSLDSRTTGMHPSELWVLAARPGVGKSALATEIAMAAAGSGVGVLFWSLEMRVEELTTRAICARARLPLATARAGRLSEWDMQRLTESAADLHGLPISWNTSSATLSRIRSEARRLKARDPGFGLVVVDYLGLVTGSGTKRSNEARHLEVAEISRGLKLLAGELDVTVLALSQLSRDVEKGKRRPYLADLRESGAVEQDANVVLFLHPSGDRDEASGSLPVELILAKQRNGPTGILPVTFRSHWTGFDDGGWDPTPPPTDEDAPKRTFAGRYRGRRK